MQPFKRAIFPYGGLRMVEAGLKAAGFEADPQVHEAFTKYRKTHNDGVFDAYTPEIMRCRKSGIITGLPDAYGRGRIIGDYRRVALYGVDRLIEAKQAERAQIDDMWPTDEVIRSARRWPSRSARWRTLPRWQSSTTATSRRPASDAQEAVQWTYFAYLGAIKEANGAAMSIGRISSFLDIYIERDLREGTLDEAGAQELWDQLVQKLRIVRFLRTPDYDALFSGDPYWATECVGGMDLNGQPLVTKSSYRMLHTLTNLGPAPEPNITVLWSKHLPDAFKRYCIKVSKETSSLQYENDDLMRPALGRRLRHRLLRLGHAARQADAVLRRARESREGLLYAINGGRDEISGDQIAPADAADDQRRARLRRGVREVRPHDGVARAHLCARDELHPLHARQVLLRAPRDGAARSRHPAHHGVRHRRPVGGGRQPGGDQVCQGPRDPGRDRARRRLRHREPGANSVPQFGNNDDRVDSIAADLVTRFMQKIRKHPTYRNATHTQSVLTITSNVVYGKATGNTPDGRRKGEPFGPGRQPDARPRQPRLARVVPLGREAALQGFAGRHQLHRLGRAAEGAPVREELIDGAVKAFDTYFDQGGFHMNLNVVDKETLEDAMKNPDKYPQLTIRVSGYAVNFVRLTPEQQRDVISRTFHGQV